MYTYSFFILCVEFHVACVQTKFCQSCYYHTKKVEQACHSGIAGGCRGVVFYHRLEEV